MTCIDGARARKPWGNDSLGARGGNRRPGARPDGPARRRVGSTSHSGWPGGRYLWYQLISGSDEGEIVYVAEHLRMLVPAGRRIDAGQRVAIAIPGSPWIETGWATEYGSTRASPCYKEGDATHSGKTFARFLLDVDAPGSSHPTGKLC